MPELFLYQITITGRIRADSAPEAEEKLKEGLNLSIPIHDSVDGITFNTKVDPDSFTELRRRFE